MAGDSVCSVNGVNVHNAIGNIGLSLNAIPGDSLRIRLHTGDPLNAITTQFCCLAGVWLDVLLIIGTDAWVHLNDDIVLTKEVPANMRALPFRDVRLWGAGSSAVEFDNFIVRGNGVTADEAVSWGQLKSFYR